MRKRCERARRDEGLQARLNCDICGRGPCAVEYLRGVRRQHDRDRLLALPMTVPNRLYGATINHEGEAV